MENEIETEGFTGIRRVELLVVSMEKHGKYYSRFGVI